MYFIHSVASAYVMYYEWFYSQTSGAIIIQTFIMLMRLQFTLRINKTEDASQLSSTEIAHKLDYRNNLYSQRRTIYVMYYEWFYSQTSGAIINQAFIMLMKCGRYLIFHIIKLSVAQESKTERSLNSCAVQYGC